MNLGIPGEPPKHQDAKGKQGRCSAHRSRVAETCLGRPLACVLALAASVASEGPLLAAADPPTPSPKGAGLRPALFTVKAGRSNGLLALGGELELAADKDSPVEVSYDNMLLLAELVRGRRCAWGEGGTLVIDTVDILGSREHPILFDSLATTLPQIGARMRLAPGRASARLLGPPGVGPAAQYRLVLDDCGDFSGDLQERAGWRGLVGWAKSVAVYLSADVTSEKMGKPVLRSLVMLGDPGDPSAGRKPRPAIVNRYDCPIGGANGDGLSAFRDHWTGEVRSQEIVLEFSIDGKLSGAKTGQDVFMQGNPFDFQMGGLSVPRLEKPGTAQ